MTLIRKILFGSCTCSCGMISRYGCVNNKHCHNKSTGCNI